MYQLQKYHFERSKPLSQPYDKDGIYNACFLGFQEDKQRSVLITIFQEPKFERTIAKSKRLLKLKQIKHPNISQIYEVILDRDNKQLYVILQWCAGGTIYDYEKMSSTVDCDLAIKILHDLMIGLEKIHQNNEMHRYINMQNVQFGENGTPKFTFRCLYPKTYYLSPEDKQGNRTKQSDLFSLGVLLYKFLIGQTPFKGNNIQEQSKSVFEGPKFPKDQKQMFPISLPIQIKQLIIGMTKFQANERYPNNYIIQQCQNYLHKVKMANFSHPNFSFSVSKRIFGDKLIPLFTRFTSSDQHLIICLYPQKHQLTKIHIYRSKSISSNNNYLKSLQPFKQSTQQNGDLIPVIEAFIVEDEYIVVRSLYDNQGSLQTYLQRGGSILQSNVKSLIQSAIKKVKTYGKNYNYLTKKSLLIRKGKMFLSYPPFQTKSFLKQLKNDVNLPSFIAPQIKQGKSSDKADSWSIGMLKYNLVNGCFANFDANGKINTRGLNSQQAKYYQGLLQSDHRKRKNLFQSELKINIPEIRQSSIKVQSARKNIKPISVVKPFVPKQPKKTIGQILAQKLYLFQFLQKGWSKPVRIGFKCVIGLILLIFLFYLNFFLINGQLITEHSLYSKKVVLIRAFSTDSTPQISYPLVTKTPLDTYNLFYNATLYELRDDYQCVLNSYSVNSNIVQVINSSSFITYQVFGILFSVFNLIIFCISLSKMDFAKAFFISKLEQNNFNQMINWMFINLALASQTSCIYLLYGSLFHMTLQPCISKATLTAVQFLLKKWYFSFCIRYIWIYVGLLFSYAVIFFFIIKPHYIVHKYAKIGLIALYLAGCFCRIMGGSGGSISGTKQSVFGKSGELLLILMSVIFFIIDLIFAFANKGNKAYEAKRFNKISDNSEVQINQTEMYCLPQ